MSVLIRGMKMPKSCEDCKVRTAAGCYGNLPHNTRFPNCPLVEIPPHGALINREALLDEIAVCLERLEDAIDEQITIIEAEEGE